MDKFLFTPPVYRVIKEAFPATSVKCFTSIGLTLFLLQAMKEGIKVKCLLMKF